MESRVSPVCDLSESGPGLPLRLMFRLVAQFDGLWGTNSLLTVIIRPVDLL